MHHHPGDAATDVASASGRAPAARAHEPGTPQGRLRSALRRLAGERGAATAEYAVATMAMVGEERHT
jgi:hypothetical protein